MSRTTLDRILLVAAGVLLVALTTAAKPSCSPGSDPVKQDQCTVPKDCAGLAHPACVGDWQCNAGTCAWACGTPEVPCVQSGCSGQICATESLSSTCEWVDWYDCLRLTKCGHYGPNGACGFDPNADYLACLAKFQKCATDTDCEAGLVCRDGACGKPDPTVPCQQDAECKDGEYCKLETVCPPCVTDPVNPCKVACQMVGTCTPKPTPVECKTDADCPTGLTCQEDVQCPACVYADPPCKAPCLQVFVCKEPPVTTCSTDADCPEGQVCQLDPTLGCGGTGAGAADPAAGVACMPRGTCVPGTTQIPCQSDAECPKGQQCYWTGACPPCACDSDPACACPDCMPALNGWCGPAQTCIPAPEVCDGLDNDCNGLVDDGCQVQCYTDAECPAGQYCDFVTPTCPAGAMCVMVKPAPGTCQPKPVVTCLTDADCAAGEYCDRTAAAPADPTDPAKKPVAYGVCTPNPDVKCQSDADCAADQYCELQQPYDAAGVLACCPPNAMCTAEIPPCAGVCRDKPLAGCTRNEDCATGQFCDFSGVLDPGGCCLPDQVCLAIYAPCQGVCRMLDGLCWTDADCKKGSHCEGAIVCPPGAACFVADQPGKCVPDAAACTAVKPGSHGACKMLLGFVWDGTQCVAEGGCTCEPDCAFFFATPEACQQACIPTPPACAADSDCALGESCINGACVLTPGLCWTDADCKAADHCEGAIVCPPGAMCLVADRPGKCVPDAAACTAVKPYTHGACDMVLGWIFDGTSCTVESGCSCGADCASFFKTVEDCQAACAPVVPVACKTDAECAGGEYCAVTCTSAGCAGTCAAVPAGTCVKDADCAAQNLKCVIEACPACYPCPCFGKCG